MPEFLKALLAKSARKRGFIGRRKARYIYGAIATDDWNWIAGIWEGEGTACITTQAQRKPWSPGKRIVVTITQKDRSMLEEVKRLTATGSIHPGSRASHWVIASRCAREFLTTLMPYVRSQRRRIQIVRVLAIDAEQRAIGKKNLREANQRRMALAKVS